MAENLTHKASFQAREKQVKLVSNDEIEIVEVLVTIVNFFKKYSMFMLASVALGLLTGFMWFQSITPLYKSDFILRASRLSAKELTVILNGVHAGGSIGELTVSPITDDPNSVSVSVSSQQPEKFSEIKSGIINTIDQNSVVARYANEEKTVAVKTINELKTEETRVATLIEKLAAASQSKIENSSLPEMIRLKTDLFKERISVESRLANFSSVILIDGDADKVQFTPVNKNLSIILMISVTGFFILSVAIMGVIELLKTVRNHEENTRLAVSLSSLSLRRDEVAAIAEH
jgi:hypothetical protein